MHDERRQRLNVHVIRTSFAAAVRSLPAEEVHQAVSRASVLLDDARRNATTPVIQRDLDALQSELDRYVDLEGSGKAPG